MTEVQQNISAPPASSPSPCSPPGPYLPGLISSSIGHALSATVAVFTAAKVAAWLPSCLSLVILPGGKVSHDPWSWVPLGGALFALVAIGAPVSFSSVLSFAKSIPLLGSVTRAKIPDDDWRR